MMNFLRVAAVLLLLLISVCVVAQTKEYMCFDMPVWVVQSNAFSRHVSFEQPLHQEGIDLIFRSEINLTHIVRPPQFSVPHRTMVDASKSNLMLPLRWESPRVCQMGDRLPNGSIQFH
jgi:hypothetical protein